MSRTTVHFRCPRCQRYHSVAVTKVGRSFICPTCFGPMVVPEAAGTAPSKVPIAQSIELPPPSAAVSPASTPVLDPVPELGADDCQEWHDPAPPDEPSDVPQNEERSLAGTKPPARMGKRTLVAVVCLILAICTIVGLSGSRGLRDEGLRAASLRPTTRPVMAGGSARGRNDSTGADTRGTPPAPRVRLTAMDTPPAPAIVSMPTPQQAMAANQVAPPRPANPPMPPVPVLEPQQASPAQAVPIAQRPALPGSDEAPTPPSKPVQAIAPRRRQTLDQEALRRQLAKLPEVILRRPTADALLTPQGTMIAPQQQARRQFAVGSIGSAISAVVERRKAQPVTRPQIVSLGPLALIGRMQPELATLPWSMGDDCHLGREPAEDLQIHSRALRDLLQETTPPGEIRPNPEWLRVLLLDGDAEEFNRLPPTVSLLSRSRSRRSWVEAAAIPALLQLLAAERTPTRLVLVDVLAEIRGKEAVTALARLALFDIAPEVRDRAILALRNLPAEDYRPTLLGGFRYPWPPVADHAAEALVALEDRGAIPDLVKLLDEQDPQGPSTEMRNGRSGTVVRSLVRINHLKNCLLCHALSTSPTTDLVRGRVPTPEQPLPPPKQYYGDSSPGLFVRAEVTYLRQDFSVTQTVEDPAPWPSYQRYDYLVSERLVASWDRMQKPVKKDTYPQRESVLFALRELNGKDLGITTEDWQAASQSASPDPSDRPRGD
jgi:hypothetical protein